MMFKTAKNITDIEEYRIVNKELLERIKIARKIKGLSQIQLAKISGLDRSSINEIERNPNHNIKLDTLRKLMTVLDNEILLDDYCKFILNQQEVIQNQLINLVRNICVIH